jgi:hypothetical protein
MNRITALLHAGMAGVRGWKTHITLRSAGEPVVTVLDVSGVADSARYREKK